MKFLAVLSFSMTLLAAAGFSRYQAASRMDAVRKNLAAQAARVNAAIQSGQCADFQQIDFELQRIRKESRNQIVWIQIRDESGAVRSHAGMRASATFPLDAAKAQLRRGRPMFSLLETPAGTVLLEAFPVQLPSAKRRDVTILSAVDSGDHFGVVEIASPINSRASASRQMLPNFL